MLCESYDVNVPALLGIAIVFFSSSCKNINHMAFLNLVLLRKCEASGVITALKDKLLIMKDDMSNLLAIHTVTASAAIGADYGEYEK